MKRQLHPNHRMKAWDLKDQLLPILPFSWTPNTNILTQSLQLGCPRVLMQNRFLPFVAQSQRLS